MGLESVRTARRRHDEQYVESFSLYHSFISRENHSNTLENVANTQTPTQVRTYRYRSIWVKVCISAQSWVSAVEDVTPWLCCVTIEVCMKYTRSDEVMTDSSVCRTFLLIDIRTRSRRVDWVTPSWPSLRVGLTLWLCSRVYPRFSVNPHFFRRHRV